MGKLENSLRPLASDTSGGVSVIFSIALIPLLVATGVAIDLAHVTAVRTTIQGAADAGALAGASLVTTKPAERVAAAEVFFAANAPQSPASVTVAIEPDKVIVDARETVSLFFGGILGLDTTDVNAHAEAIVRNPVKVEIALALDYSGSMNRDGKYQAMRDSAIWLIDTLMAADTGDNVEIGLVPFSDFVYADMTTTFIRGVHPDKYGYEVRACLDSRRYPHATQETTPVPADQDTKWPAPGMPAAYRQAGSVPSGTGPNGTIAEVGCNGNDTEYSAGGDGDDDSDSDDGGGGFTADRCERRYSRSEVQGQKGEARLSDFASADAQCEEYRKRRLLVLPLTTDDLLLKSQLSAMSPLRMTNIALALEYAWHLVSPNAPFSEGGNYSDGDSFKAVVLLSDGAQTVGGFGPGASFNIAQANRNTEDICEGIKAREIIMITIAFGKSINGGTQKMLQKCSSGSDYYFRPQTNEELATVFEDLTLQFTEYARLVR